MQEEGGVRIRSPLSSCVPPFFTSRIFYLFRNLGHKVQKLVAIYIFVKLIYHSLNVFVLFIE